MQYLGHSWLYPPGSIMPYIGTTDPDGWIICNGVTRTSTDSRYAALSVLLGGNANSITPPDLRSKFLRGNSTVSASSDGGSATVTLTTANIPTHSHAITINETAHTHNNTYYPISHDHSVSIWDNGHSHNNYTTEYPHAHSCELAGLDDGNGSSFDDQCPPSDSSGFTGNGWNTRSVQTGMYVNYVSTETTGLSAEANITSANITLTNAYETPTIIATSADVGTSTSFSINPEYIGVNYIIKY